MLDKLCVCVILKDAEGNTSLGESSTKATDRKAVIDIKDIESLLG